MNQTSHSLYGCALLIIATIVLSPRAEAMVVDLGKVTLDQKTGLEWLDLPETRGLSFNEVESQITAGARLEGWRHASIDEISQFWVNAGGEAPFAGAARGQEDWVGRLQLMWGVTYPFLYLVNGFTVQGSVAMTSDVSSACPACQRTVYLLENVDRPGSSLGDIAEAVQVNEALRNDPQTPIGHALVRNTSTLVPEPDVWRLFAVGALGLMLTQRGHGKRVAQPTLTSDRQRRASPAVAGR